MPRQRSEINVLFIAALAVIIPAAIAIGVAASMKIGGFGTIASGSAGLCTFGGLLIYFKQSFNEYLKMLFGYPNRDSDTTDRE